VGNEGKVGGGSQGWSEGGPVESMTPDVARAEIKAIEADQNFAGDGQMPHWDRQRMLKRRDALYRHAAGPEGDKEYSGMEETLHKQGITKESLERDQERFEERDAKEVEGTLEERLFKHFGSEEEANKKVKSAQALVKKYVQNPRDLQFLDDSGLGNNFEVIGMVARLHEILEEGRSKMRLERKSKRGGVEREEVTELTRRGGEK